MKCLLVPAKRPDLESSYASHPESCLVETDASGWSALNMDDRRVNLKCFHPASCVISDTVVPYSPPSLELWVPLFFCNAYRQQSQPWLSADFVLADGGSAAAASSAAASGGRHGSAAASSSAGIYTCLLCFCMPNILPFRFQVIQDPS